MKKGDFSTFTQKQKQNQKQTAVQYIFGGNVVLNRKVCFNDHGNAGLNKKLCKYNEKKSLTVCYLFAPGCESVRMPEKQKYTMSRIAPHLWT